MATPIRMPDLGTNVEEIRLIEWLKQEGDTVRRGDPLCEVETDKATDQLESVAEGVLLRQVVPAGGEILAGTVIAYIGQPGESIPEPATHAHGHGLPTVPALPTAGLPKTAGDLRSESGAGSGGPRPAHGSGEPRPASAISAAAPKVPLVIRNLAQREGVDLGRIAGTGPGGQITREDVLNAKASASAAEDQRTVPFSPQGVPLPKEQLAVARQVARSNREIPTIDLTATVEMSAVNRRREESSQQQPTRLAYDSFFLYAVAQAIKRFSTFVAHGGDDRVYPHETADVCLAISRDTRLYLPVVRSADRLSWAEIDAEVRRLVEKTRGGRLRPDDLTGGCFTVSNLGMYGIDSFQMIIPPEQSGALAIGAVQHRVISRDGKIALRPVATIVLSVDHRIINGALAAEFLRHVKDVLETI